MIKREAQIQHFFSAVRLTLDWLNFFFLIVIPDVSKGSRYSAIFLCMDTSGKPPHDSVTTFQERFSKV